MNDQIFLNFLQQKGININLKGEKLHIDAPKGAVTEEIKEELKVRKESLITIINGEEKERSEILKFDRYRYSGDQQIPVSYAQQSFLFLEQLKPGNTSNYLVDAFRIRGDLNIGALTESLNTIRRRHQILRTNFYYRNGRPYQKVHPFEPVEIRKIDLTGIPESNKEKEFRRRAEIEIKKVFDLENDLLFTTCLFQLSEKEYIFLIKVHHIIFDGFSFGLFYNELSTCYAAFHTGKKPDLPEINIQYGDYATWQRKLFEEGALKKEVEYWKKKLKNAPAELEVPTDRPRPKVQTYNGDKYSFTIDKQTYSALKKMSREYKCSLFMVLVALYNVLLHRYSHQNDILTGFPISIRTQPELENLLGMFANMLVLRTKLSSDTTFVDLLGKSKKATSEAYSNQQVQFEKLVEELNIARDPGRNPLFQYTIGLQPSENFELNLKGLKVTSESIHIPSAQFDFHFQFWENKDHLRGSVEYNTDLFDRATIVRMLGHFKRIARSVTENPDREISQLPILTESEIQQLEAWNNTGKQFETEDGLLELLQKTAEENSDSTALICEGKELTYRQLHDRADKVAAFLQNAGVGPDQLVGIYMERSIEMIVAVLGIIKAGGAYLPLDPSFPEDRLTFMLDDAALKLILTQEKLLDKIPESAAETVAVDGEWGKIANTGYTCKPPKMHPDNMAYVIYTSGSTGKPKGVMVTHKNLLAYCLAVNDKYGMTHKDRFLQFSTISFDIFVEEVFTSFTTGACLVLRNDDIMKGTSSFWDFVNKYQISVIHLPTAYWHILCSQMDEENIPKPEKLWMVAAGGEAMSLAMLEKWHKYMSPDIRMLNSYGPTEATVAASTFDATDYDTRKNHILPIGKPLKNVKLYILDEYGNKCPVGVPGELFIGGPQVARGYLNRPELTDERFIDDPFTDVPNSKMYKTGDICRFLPDGNIEYTGRNDFQVKLRGLRIELGEIEQTLLRHPSVKEAVVKLYENKSGHKQLVGYLVPQKEKIDLHSVQNEIKQKLAAFMLPDSYVVLDELPLTINGKIDKKALPDPERSNLITKNEIVEPRNELEVKIKKIWKKVLDVRPIGVTDNFFDIGGNSLKAVLLFDELSKLYGSNLPLATLFEAPTIAQLASVLNGEDQQGVKKFSGLVVKINANKNHSLSPFFCVHGHFGNVLNFERLAKELEDFHPFYGLQAIGITGNQKPLTDITKIVERYVDEIKKIQPEGPYFIGGYCYGSLVALEIAHQLNNASDDVAKLVMLDVHPISYPKLLPKDTLNRFLKFLNRYRINKLKQELVQHNSMYDKFKYSVNRIRKKIVSQISDKSLLFAFKISEKLDLALLETFLNVEIGNKIAAKKYIRKKWLKDIDVFLSRKITEGYSKNPKEDWKGMAAGEVRIHLIEDDGMFDSGAMFKEPYVYELAEELKQCLKRTNVYQQA